MMRIIHLFSVLFISLVTLCAHAKEIQIYNPPSRSYPTDKYLPTSCRGFVNKLQREFEQPEISDLDLNKKREIAHPNGVQRIIVEPFDYVKETGISSLGFNGKMDPKYSPRDYRDYDEQFNRRLNGSEESSKKRRADITEEEIKGLRKDSIFQTKAMREKQIDKELALQYLGYPYVNFEKDQFVEVTLFAGPDSYEDYVNEWGPTRAKTGSRKSYQDKVEKNWQIIKYRFRVTNTNVKEPQCSLLEVKTTVATDVASTSTNRLTADDCKAGLKDLEAYNNKKFGSGFVKAMITHLPDVKAEKIGLACYLGYPHFQKLNPNHITLTDDSRDKSKGQTSPVKSTGPIQNQKSR